MQETRLWDPERGLSQSMRSKEHAHDYRYFPEPDLPPLAVDQAWIEQARQSLPELPENRYRRYTSDLGLSAQDAGVLISEREIARLLRRRKQGLPRTGQEGGQLDHQ